MIVTFLINDKKINIIDDNLHIAYQNITEVIYNIYGHLIPVPQQYQIEISSSHQNMQKFLECNCGDLLIIKSNYTLPFSKKHKVSTMLLSINWIWNKDHFTWILKLISNLNQ